jgi:hypothetical protein
VGYHFLLAAACVYTPKLSARTLLPLNTPKYIYRMLDASYPGLPYVVKMSPRSPQRPDILYMIE